MSERATVAGIVLAAVLGMLGSVTAGEEGDPTRPSYLRPETAAPADAVRTPSWRLESIIVSPGRRIAVINGRAVGLNEWIGGARVVEILPYEVGLEYRGEIRRIVLVPTRIKRPSN